MRRPMNKKAVVIARDVLKHLRGLRLREGWYIKGSVCEDISEKSLKEHVDLVQKECEVCLLGACLLSKIRLYDEVDLDAISSRTHKTTSFCVDFYVDRDRALRLLFDVFSEEQMDLMETVFEKGIVPFFPEAGEDELNRAVAFGQRYKTKKACVKAVMENVIANRGYFDPSKSVKKKAKVVPLQGVYLRGAMHRSC